MKRRGKRALRCSYFLSSLRPKARRIGTAIRGHWSIENGLHWVLDVVFREDARRLYDRTAAENVAFLNRLALSLFRGDTGKSSLKVKRKRAGWHLPYLAQLLGFSQHLKRVYRVITDHHQPYIKAVASILPLARHVRTGLHRHRGYTTQPVERSHVPTRDRLRGARGLRTVPTGQKFLESFEVFHALRRGTVKLRALVPGYRPTQVSEHEKVRTVLTAMEVLGTQLQKAA